MSGNKESERAFMGFLRRGRIIPSEVPVEIAQADGRNAAVAGYSIRTNPYRIEREPEQHRAWLEGYTSVRTRKTSWH